jgi:gamma-polyglutamate synthase
MTIKDRILPAISEFDRRIQMPFVDDVAREADQQPDYRVPVDGLPAAAHASASALHKLMLVVESYDQSRAASERSFLTLSRRVATTRSARERRVMILDFIHSLTPGQPRKRSRRAVSAPYLDLDVAEELYRKRILHGAMKQRIAIAALGRICQDMLRSLTNDGAVEQTVLARAVEALEIERFIMARVDASSRWQNKVAAFDALGRILRAMPGEHVFGLISLGTSRRVARYALDPYEHSWIQISALRLLVDLSPEDALDAIRHRLADTEGPPDNLFVRKAIVEAVGDRYRDESGHDVLTQLAERADPSDYVRMHLVRVLATYDTEDSRALLRRFLEDTEFEACPQVRAQAVIEWSGIGRSGYVTDDAETSLQAAAMLAWAVTNADEPNVQRVAAEECVALCEFGRQATASSSLDAVATVLLRALEETVADPSVDLRVRRWAGSAWGSILTRRLPEWDEVAPALHAQAASVPEGGAFRVRRSDLPIDEAALGRVLAELSRDSLGLYATFHRRHVRIVRGDRMRLAPWRILHELRHLSPDKRQGFPHTVGRVFGGAVRAHSEILGEITRTKVPGERYHIEGEDSWRRYVPLVDDYLSLCRPSLAGKVVRLYSSTGVTSISGPKRWFGCLRAFARLSWNYARVAELRNAPPRERGVGGVHEYIRVMREKYGMTTTFTPYTYDHDGGARRLHDRTIEDPMSEGSPTSTEHAHMGDIVGSDAAAGVQR